MVTSTGAVPQRCSLGVGSPFAPVPLRCTNAAKVAVTPVSTRLERRLRSAARQAAAVSTPAGFSSTQRELHSFPAGSPASRSIVSRFSAAFFTFTTSCFLLMARGLPPLAQRVARDRPSVMPRVLLLGIVLLSAACAPPPPTSEVQLPAASTRDVWVLVVHGSGDGPARWATGMVEALRPRLAQPGRVELLAYDWEAAAVDKLSAAENGQREGRAIATVIAGRELAHVHVIAHSAGAHVAHGVELGLAELPTRPTLHLTLLDPYCGKGLDFEWGVSRFGTKADFTEDLLDTGDGVPGTELPVRAAHTFDVTAAKPAGAQWAGKEGHWWPTAAYLEHEPGFSLSLEASGSFDVAALRERWPAGGVER